MNLVKIEEPEIFEINRDFYADDVFNDPLLKIEPVGPGDKAYNVESADISDGFEMFEDYELDGHSAPKDTASGGNTDSVEVKCEVLVGQKSTLLVDQSLDNVQNARSTSELAKEICEEDATSVLQNYRQSLLLRSFECDICKKRYKSKSDIRQHKITCHGHSKGRFECDICHKR